MTLWLLTVSTALIGVAVLVGYSLPASALIRQLHLSECVLPCWIGIVPGATTTGEAMRRFKETFAPTSDPQPYASAVTSSIWVEMSLPAPEQTDTILVQLEFVEGVTNRILIQGRLYGVLDTMPRVGDVVRLFGSPSCVNPQSPGFHGWSLLYETPGGVVVVGVLGRDSIAWTQPVYFVYMRRRSATEDYEACSVFQPWRGLQRSRYLH